MRTLQLGFVVFVLLCLLFGCSCPVYGSDEAVLKIDEAEAAVSEAFAAVSGAESAGANVSLLVARLNGAGALLSWAGNAFRVGDFENATLFAEQSLSMINGTVEEASALRSEAESAKFNTLVLTASFSSVGLCLLFVVSLFVWRSLRRRFVRRALGMRPEEVAAS